METFKNEQVNSTKIHQKQSNVPQIRFKSFNDAWEQRKALNIAEYSKGNGYSKGDLKESGTPIILYGRLYTNYQFSIGEVDTFVSPKNDSIYSQGNEVIVPASGESAEDIARASAVEKSGVLLGGDLNVIRPFNFIFPLFLAIAISNGEIQKELAKKAQGKSVVHIHNSDIQKLEISYPELEEQKQIGAIFLKIDKLITLHQRKCDQLKNIKKSLLEKLFPKNGTLYPELRFKGFTDAWEQCKLDEITNRVLRKNKNLESELPLTISAQEGLVDQEKFFNKRIASKDLRNYLLVENGEFAYNKSYSSGYPWGVIKRLYKYPRGVVSSLYIVFSPILDKIDSSFLVVFFESELWHSQISKRAAEGARNHGLLNIQASDFFDIDLTLSSLSEQRQIGQFFKDLDNLITLHQRKVEKLKKVKASLLEKMFV